MGNEVKVLKDDMSTWWNKLPEEVRSVALVSAGVLGGIGLGRATGAFKNKAPAMKRAPSHMPITSRLFNFEKTWQDEYEYAQKIADAAAAAVTEAQNALTAATGAEKIAKDKWVAAEKDAAEPRRVVVAAKLAADAAKKAATEAEGVAAVMGIVAGGMGGPAATATAVAARAAADAAEVAAAKAAKSAASDPLLQNADNLKNNLDQAVSVVTNAENQLVAANASNLVAQLALQEALGMPAPAEEEEEMEPEDEEDER